MKLWPFQKHETRQENSYTDALVEQLITRAQGNVTGGHTSIREIIAGAWARAFASATPAGAPGIEGALNAKVLYGLGRSLALSGRWIAEIAVGPQGLYLERADSYVVSGLGPEWEWEYELSSSRPSGQVTRYLPAARVVDVRLGDGVAYESPLTGAATTNQLLDNLEARLAEEAGTPSAYVLPVGPGEKQQLASDIKGLKGSLGVTETSQRSGMDSPKNDYQPVRFGASPPEGLVTLRNNVEASLLAAAGTPNSIANSDGSAIRRTLPRIPLWDYISRSGRVLS